MVLLILFIISYGALLILLLPATIPGLVCVVAAFVLGSGLIICKKLFRNISWKLCPFFLILATVFIVVNLGCDFFHRWLSHFELYAIGSMFHIPIRTVVLIGSFVLSVAASYFIYSFLWAIKFFGERASKYRLAVSILFILTSAVLTVVSAQKKLGISNLFSMGFLNLIFGVLIVSIVILFLFCLTGRPIASIIMGSGLFMLISTINVYVYMFRHRLFEPVDIFSAGTAMNVIGNYSLFPVPFTIIDELEIFIITLILFYCFLQKGKFHLASKQRISLLSFCTVACLATAIYLANLKPYHWDILGLEYNGYILDFVLKIKEITVSKPDNYSPEEISELSKLYSLNENNVDERGREQPHIIVIMDEAFSDLSVNGDFSTNIYPMPFISSLKENTVSGYALSSVYGGNTANSEYEFLTGKYHGVSFAFFRSLSTIYPFFDLFYDLLSEDWVCL